MARKEEAEATRGKPARRDEGLATSALAGAREREKARA